jgi:hypothetical protein
MRVKRKQITRRALGDTKDEDPQQAEDPRTSAGDSRAGTFSRRELLKRSMTLGLAALIQRMLGSTLPPNQFTRAQGTPPPPDVDGLTTQDLDYVIHLPIVARQAGIRAHGPSKLGLHTLRANKAVQFVQDVHDAGTQVALVKALDDFGYLREVKEISPETVTVGRWNNPPSVTPSGDPAEAAAWMLAQHMPHWRYEAHVVDYWEILNENAPPTLTEHAWLGHFFIEAMDIAEANGYRLALFSYSAGVPQWHVWEAIVETGVFARAKEGGHALALHEYDWPTMDYSWGEPTEDLPPYDDRGVLAGRYRYLYRDFLIPRDEVVPLVITECGLDPVIGHPGLPTHWKERYVEEMIWYDTKLREDEYVVGGAMFAIGTFAQWEDYDYEDLLWENAYGRSFLDYIVSLKDA